jgi:hypothetical protein
MLEDLRDYGLIWQRKVKHLHVPLFSGVVDTTSAGIVSSFQPDALGDDSDIIAATVAYGD